MILMFILVQAFVDLILTHVSLLKTFLHSARVQIIQNMFSINCIVASFAQTFSFHKHGELFLRKKK